MDLREYALLLRSRWAQILLALLVLAMVMTASLGGFAKSPVVKASKLPQQVPGAAIDSGPLLVSPQAAYFTHRVRGMNFASTDKTYLVVPVTVVNQTSGKESMATFLQEDVVRLSPRSGGGFDTKQATTLRRADDGGFALVVNPRLPTTVLAIWELPFDTPAPHQMQLGLVGRHFVEQTWLTGESAWLQDRAVGVWRLPVEDRRAHENATP